MSSMDSTMPLNRKHIKGKGNNIRTITYPNDPTVNIHADLARSSCIICLKSGNVGPLSPADQPFSHVNNTAFQVKLLKIHTFHEKY